MILLDFINSNSNWREKLSNAPYNIKIKDDVIKVQDIYSYLVEPNKYKVQIMDLPIHDYTMEELLLSNVKIKKNKVLSRIFRK